MVGNKAMIKIGVTGQNGRVGKLLIAELTQPNQNGLNFCGAISRNDDAQFLFQEADCIIDFTHPEATMEYLELAQKTKTALVIGTTGMTAEQDAKITNAAKHIPILYAANMSIGVNLLLSLVEKTAATLSSEWDIEILDTHHHNKIDSPSGTAIALGNSAKAGRDNTGDFVVNREGKRHEGDIGYAVRRGGDIVGEHTVSFYGAGERIELSHMATNRALFAQGAIKGATWVLTQNPGLYSMRDMLGL